VNKDIKLSNLVKDKNVLLVGNSSSLLKKDNSGLIDSFEFVIRFNLSISHMSTHSIGTKCDAWVFAMCKNSIILRTYQNAKIKPKVCVRYGNPFDIGDVNINLDVDKDDVRKELNIENNMHPSTGITTTWYMLNKSKPKSLTLIGFDSFSTKNFYEGSHRLSSIKTRHQPDVEKEYLIKLSEEKKIKLFDIQSQ
jgi:hypothetical protein